MASHSPSLFQEAMATLHHLRTHNLLNVDAVQEEGESDEHFQLRVQEAAHNLMQINKVLEKIFYGARAVLSVLQAGLTDHQTHCSDFVLSKDIDQVLGAWSLRFRWFDSNSINEFQTLIIYLLDCAYERKLRKQEGNNDKEGGLFEPVYVDGHNTHAFRFSCTFEEFVHRMTPKEIQFQQWSNLTHSPNTVKGVVEHLRSCYDTQLPWLIKDRHAFSFRNGVYFADRNVFHPYTSEESIKDVVVAAKYFDQPFEPYEELHDWRDIETPTLDSILDYQELPEDVKRWIYVFLGRMLYDVNEKDGWQIVLFIKGYAGTGKCFGAGTEILMYDGSSRKIEDILPGDLVMGDDSTPRTVLDLARGSEELYEICSEYGCFRVTRDHVLCLKHRWSSDEHVVEMTVGEYLGLTVSQKKPLKLYRLGGTLVYDFRVFHIPGAQPYFGFQTDGNQRFCLADGTVTHNSTILQHVVGNFYDKVDTGVMSNNAEERFGLSALHNSYIVVAPECRRDFKIEQAELQSIISGESVQINKKHKTAFSVTWTAPLIMAGNETPQFNDTANSMGRRWVIVDFVKPVHGGGDMRLGEKLGEEIPDIIVKCNRAYLEAAGLFGNRDVWSVLPNYFRKTSSEVAQSINQLEAFLASDRVIFGPEQFVPFDSFKTALFQYGSEHNFRRVTFQSDYFRGPFTQRNIIIEERASKVWRGQNIVNKMFLLGVDIVDTTETHAHF
jgi:hypothetical protein